MTTRDQAIKITIQNLSGIFNERSIEKRLATLSSIWTSSEPLLVDSLMGVHKSQQAICDTVDKIFELSAPEDVLEQIGEVECLPYDEDGDVWVTRVQWRSGPRGGKAKITGWDVVTIAGGKIKACYAFVD